jgi:hypothetical protein
MLFVLYCYCPLDLSAACKLCKLKTNKRLRLIAQAISSGVVGTLICFGILLIPQRKSCARLGAEARALLDDGVIPTNPHFFIG